MQECRERALRAMPDETMTPNAPGATPYQAPQESQRLSTRIGPGLRSGDGPQESQQSVQGPSPNPGEARNIAAPSEGYTLRKTPQGDVAGRRSGRELCS